LPVTLKTGDIIKMITLKQTFTQINLMDNFIKEYLQEYAPAGYYTEVEIKIVQSYEDWEQNKIAYEVTITRDESCD
jgi:hypothetical protein